MLVRIRRLFLAVLVCGVAGCRHSEPGASPPGESHEPKVLRIGNGTEPEELDPQVATGIPEREIMTSIFEGLVDEDPKDLHPVPAVAQSWDISEDQRTYTFHLRPGLVWSNGRPLTSNDFILTFKRLLNPKFAATNAYLVFNVVQGAKDYYDHKTTDFSTVGFKAPDPSTFVITLTQPAPYFLKLVAGHFIWYPLPIPEIEALGGLETRGSRWTRPEHIVGNGAFVLKVWDSEKKIVVERNPRYWDAKSVKLDEIDFLATEDGATEERMFRTGQLDRTASLPLGKIDVYKKEHPEVLKIAPYLGLYFYRCNVTKPPLNDKRVRKALALALDREALIRDVLKAGQTPAYSVSRPGVANYDPQVRLTGSLEDARRLLAEAGYPGGRGMPTVQILYNTNEGHKQIAEVIQQMWKTRLGVDAELVNEEWKVYLQTARSGNYQISRAGWIASYNDPLPFLDIWETGNGENETGWSNAEYDRLLHQSMAARSEDERYGYYRKMDAILVDECPVIPIYFYTRAYLLSPRVTGFWPNFLDHHPYKAIDLIR